LLFKNFAFENKKRFSDEKMNSDIEEEINELFIIDYICNRINSVLTTVLEDSEKIFRGGLKLNVLEAFNGYLILQEDRLILITLNSLFEEYKTVDNEEVQTEFHEKYLNNKILNGIKLEKSEQLYVHYSKHYYGITSGIHMDVFNTFFFLNVLYYFENFESCIVICKSLLEEFSKFKAFFSGKCENKKTKGYLDLFVFLNLFVVKLYMKLGDYFQAIQTLLEISEYEYDHTKLIFNILFGISLTKIKHCDLGAIYLGEACRFVNQILDRPEGKSYDIGIDPISGVSDKSQKEKNSYSECNFF
jgi:hypothetical protein